uniref:G protein-coupled receptor n=1 Tax=Wuchereria bancrofti TaxID=6293 RepID=A0A1I8EVG4_WUCBA
MVSSDVTLDNWYSKPLNMDDIIAGGTLILLAMIFLPVSVIISFVLHRESHVITGFLYLFSASINNMFLLINYALCPDISRYGVVFHVLSHVAGGVDTLCGYLSSMSIQKAAQFHYLHIMLYVYAIFLLFKCNRQARNSFVTINTCNTTRPKIMQHWNIFAGISTSMRAETKLILPCICNAIIFLIGQVVITIGISEGRWTIWLILVLFTLTASTDSVTLLIFSGTVRKGTLIMLRDLFCCCNKKTNVVVIKDKFSDNAKNESIVGDRNVSENFPKILRFIVIGMVQFVKKK